MTIRRTLVLIISHAAVAAAGFAGGIYALPIIIAPDSPSEQAVDALAAKAEFKSEFRRDLQDSDALHWGEGTVSISKEAVTHMGSLAPGPDYKLYLSPEFVETEADFLRLKSTMVQIGDVKTFDNFVVAVPAAVDVAAYRAVIVWCETFGQFITAAEYQ
ncbi:MAG: DM13 domain-containing protein [Burkholderiaceae bacterium]